MKCEEYKLIYEGSLTDFNELINRHLQHGWELYGNPLVFVRHNNSYYSQAVIIKATNKKIKICNPKRPILLEIEEGVSGITKIGLRKDEKYEVLYQDENKKTSNPRHGVYLSVEEAEEFLNKFIYVIGGY